MYACIFIPDFTVEAVVRAEPMLRGQAVAVLEGKPPLCYVVGANEAARRLGVEVGMTKLLAETIQKAERRQNRTAGPSAPRLRRSGRDDVLTTEEQRQEWETVSRQNEKTAKRQNGKPTENEERRTRNEDPANFTPRCFPHDDERSAERKAGEYRRPHSQGAYESTYGRVDTRFGLYRSGLQEGDLLGNEVAGNGEHRTENDSPTTNRELGTANSDEQRTTNNEELTLRQRAVAQEESAHAALLDAAHAVSPRVESAAPDTVILDADGLERLFGTPQQIAQELVRHVTEVGLVGNVAIAANPDAAEHAARGFSGVTIIPAGREAERLGILSLEVLFAAERSALMRSTRRHDEQRKVSDRFARMQETLDRWGIRNFRGLAALPPVSLSERLGTSGLRLQTLASGSATRELVKREPALCFEETVELEYPVDVLEPLAFLLARMLDGLCGRLAARALSTNELRLRMKLEHRTPDEVAKSEEELEGEPIVERKLALPVPMNDARLFLKLLQLELSATPPGAPVTQLWLEAEPARPRVGQAGLFMPLAPEPQKLELTLARLHKLLGVRDALRAGSAELLDTHQADAFKMVRFQPEEQRRAKDTEPTENGEQRPENLSTISLRRFRPPLPVEVEMRDGYPVRLSCAELGSRNPLHDNIVWSAGPWRSSGNWWEKSTEEQKIGKTEQQQRQNEKTAKRQSETAGPSRTRLRRSGRDDGLIGEGPAGAGERGTENVLWNCEEWDIALAITSRGPNWRERETQIGLYRLVRDREGESWTIEGGYD